MDLDKNRSTLIPTSPGYDFQAPNDFVSWPVDSSLVPGLCYSPSSQADESAGDYFSTPRNQASWPPLDAFSRAPMSAPLSTSVAYFTGEGLISPEGWVPETDSDSCEFSPVDGRHPAPEADAAPTARRSWSQPSSPSIEVESLPSSFRTGGKYKSPSTSFQKASTSSKAKPPSKLRTASRKTRQSTGKHARNTATPSEVDSIATDEMVTPEELRARRNHNLVEKQYRNRLNAQFERLLSVLPSDQQRRPGYGGGGGDAFGGGEGGGGADDDGSTGDDKRMSKAEVLDVATRRIKELEMERRRLQRERRDLLQNMEMMNGPVP